MMNDPINQTELHGLNDYFNKFKSLYDNSKLPSKILISGPKGIGKFTLALHLINYILSSDEDFKYDVKNLKINKENRTFKLIKNNSSPNLYLIDALADKKSIEIGQIRDLINFCNKSSLNNKPRFILIDNIETMNLNSNNALLKTLEEPNENIFFILINHSQKVLSTIKSRCLNFKINLSQKKIFEIFKKITNLNTNDFINDKLISHYFTVSDLINLYTFSKENKCDLLDISLKDFLIKIIDENHYKKEILNLDLIYTLIQMFFLNRINFNNNYEFYSKFIESIQNTKKYNLDIESLFIQFRHQLNND